MNETAKDLRNPKSSQAKGLLASVISEDFVVCLIFFLGILTDINVLSKALQKDDTCIARCANAAKGLILKLESTRNENVRREKWKEVKEFVTVHNINTFSSDVLASSCSTTTLLNADSPTSSYIIKF